MTSTAAKQVETIEVNHPDGGTVAFSVSRTKGVAILCAQNAGIPETGGALRTVRTVLASPFEGMRCNQYLAVTYVTGKDIDPEKLKALATLVAEYMIFDEEVE